MSQKKPLKDCMLIVAMVTPFKKNGEVNIEKTIELAKFLIEKQDVDGLVICGTTGESPCLRFEEELELFRAIYDAVDNQVYLINGTGSNCTDEAAKRTKKVANLDICDATLHAIGYYNIPPQEGIYQHFEVIANIGHPVILYNVPSRTIVNIDPETIIKLAKKHPNIIAIKECNMNQVPNYMQRVPHDFLLFTGEDTALFGILWLGGQGIISVAGHFIGRKMKHTMKDFVLSAKNINQREKIRSNFMNKYLKFINELFHENSNPINAKYLLNYLGLDVGGYRLPLVEPNDMQKSRIIKAGDLIGATLRENFNIK